MYQKIWDIVVALALIITAIVTPFEVCFVQDDSPLLFVVNRVLDVMFAKDMVLK